MLPRLHDPDEKNRLQFFLQAARMNSHKGKKAEGKVARNGWAAARPNKTALATPGGPTGIRNPETGEAGRRLATPI